MYRRFDNGAGTFAIGFFIFWLLSILFSLALTVAAIYAVCHFVIKYW